MLKNMLAAIAAVIALPAAAQTMTVTVNGQTFEMPAGVTATFITDENGTRMVSTTQVAAATAPRAPRTPVAYYAPPARAEYAQPAPRLDYAGFDAPADEPALGEGRVLRIKRDRMTGHFIAPVLMNGVKRRVIIDTGAMSTILSPEDAAAIGADRDVRGTRPGVGIGGYTTLYMTRVRQLEIGGRSIGGFDADIGQQGIPQTLLGQTEISKLGTLVIADGEMIIYPKGVQLASR